MTKKFDLTRYTGKTSELNKPKSEKKYALYDKITLEDNNKEIDTSTKESPIENILTGTSESTIKSNTNPIENINNEFKKYPENTNSSTYAGSEKSIQKNTQKSIDKDTLKNTEKSTANSLNREIATEDSLKIEKNKKSYEKNTKKETDKKIIESSRKRAVKNNIKDIVESTVKGNIKEDGDFVIASPKKTKIGFDNNLHEYLKTEAYKKGLSLSAYMNEILRLTPDKVINNYHDGKFDTATMYYVPRSARGKQGVKSTVIFAGDVYDKMIKGAAARQQNLTQYVNLVVAAAKSINES